MQLDRKEYEVGLSIDYFVRQKLKAGEEFVDSETWATQWLEQYVKNNKRADENFYKAYHRIPESVELWKERMNIKSPNEKPKKEKKRIEDFTLRKNTRELMEKNRYMTLVPFENLKVEEYKMIADWLNEEKEIPKYLKGIIKYKPTFEERLEKSLRTNISQAVMKSENKLFYLFLTFFFMMLMLLNL